MTLQVDYSQWEKGKDYPEWMNEVSLATISKGYLLANETPKLAFRRVANRISQRLDRPDLANKFYRYMWKGWLNLASPVLSNTGTDRGLPISCFGIDTPDSIRGIGLTNAELMRLTSLGGGVGIGLSKIRGRGAKIGNGEMGQSEGVVPWAKIYDSTIIATNQGAVRRGAASVNLHINHPDIHEYLNIRRPKGDPNRQCLNLHQCVIVDDAFMQRLEHRDAEAMELWVKILKSRVETGEPYIMYDENVNNANPPAYKKNNLDVYRVDLSQVVSKYIGETEKNLASIFDIAENKNWILFFDEAESLFSKRTAVSDSKDKFANQETAYLLQRVEIYNGLIILATNLKPNIDLAFSRRLQSVINFPMPNYPQRKELWINALSGISDLTEDEIDNIAKSYKISGGSIKNVIQFSWLKSKANKINITLQDLLIGIRRELNKDGKSFEK